MVRLPRLFRHGTPGGTYPANGDRPPVGSRTRRGAGPRRGRCRSGQINVQSSNYWSATTNAGNASNAWNVNLNDGKVNANDKTNALFAWCVRGAA